MLSAESGVSRVTRMDSGADKQIRANLTFDAHGPTGNRICRVDLPVLADVGSWCGDGCCHRCAGLRHQIVRSRVALSVGCWHLNRLDTKDVVPDGVKVRIDGLCHEDFPKNCRPFKRLTNTGRRGVSNRFCAQNRQQLHKVGSGFAEIRRLSQASNPCWHWVCAGFAEFARVKREIVFFMRNPPVQRLPWLWGVWSQPPSRVPAARESRL